MSDIKIKDRDSKVEMLRLALNIAGISIDYKTTDLVNEIFIAVKDNPKIGIDEIVKLEQNRAKHWNEYFARLRMQKLKGKEDE